MAAPSDPHIKFILDAYEERIAALILRAWETWRAGRLGERYVLTLDNQNGRQAER